MSLFSGMKLASSSPDNPSKGGSRMAEPKVTKPLARTETVQTAAQETSNQSQFSFILKVDDGKQENRPTCRSKEGANEHGEVGDQRSWKDSSPVASQSQPPSQVLDDLNFDLDPIKVNRDAKTQSWKCQPTGFDLQDLDFSQLRVCDRETPDLGDEHSSLDVVRSASSFSFITKETSVTSMEKSAIEEDSQTQGLSDEVHVVRKGRAAIHVWETTSRGDDGDLSLLDRRKAMQEEHMQRLGLIKKAACDLTSQAVQLAKECVLSGQHLAEKQQQMQVLQQQEQEAVGEEDYERAEDLQHQCQALEEVIRHSHSLLLPNDHPALRSLLKELQSLYQQERVEREGVIREQQRLIAQQEERVACARGHRAQWEADRLRKVQEERSKLDRDLGHLHLDKDHLFKRETCLAEQIAEGTVHLRQSRDSLMEDRARVQEEIESLEAKLSALRLRENIFSEAILKKDREMETVTAGFKDEQSALEKEKGTLEGVELELRRRREQLDNEEQRLAGRMEEVKMTEESETRLLVDLREDLSKQEDAISNLEDKDGFTLAEIWLENKSTPLSERREKLLKQKEAAQLKYEKVQKATSSLLQSQTRVVSLRKRVSDTEGHIASLTETKQLAVSGRNFAEAKRLTEEIKQLTAEGQSIQKKMEEVSKSNEERSETVKTMMEDAERMQEEINEEERKTELMIKDNLVEHIANVRDRLQSISSSSLMRTLLKAELASSALQAKLLCLKHGEPFLAEVEELTEGSVVEEIDDCPELTQEEHQVWEELPSDEGLKTAQMELERLESQLQEAVQQEDYDRAELLQRHIDAIHQQNQTLENNS